VCVDVVPCMWCVVCVCVGVCVVCVLCVCVLCVCCTSWVWWPLLSVIMRCSARRENHGHVVWATSASSSVPTHPLLKPTQFINRLARVIHAGDITQPCDRFLVSKFAVSGRLRLEPKQTHGGNQQSRTLSKTRWRGRTVGRSLWPSTHSSASFVSSRRTGTQQQERKWRWNHNSSDRGHLMHSRRCVGCICHV
jgi:hypothetical protein